MPEILNFTAMNPHSITIQNILVLTKLQRDNYLIWKALFALIFQRYKLTGIIDGSEVYSQSYFLYQFSRGTGIPNPDFEMWYEKDQNILLWLNSTLSE